MVAGSKYRGEFEERVKQVLDEIVANQNDLIIFIDELHTIVGAGQGGGEGGLDIANTFKPALARGELHLIGATTLNEYQKHIEKDAALERRFQPVMVPEPSVEETIEILRGLRDRFEAHHKVKITEAAIAAAAKLSDRYIAARFLPDKAIDLIDQAAARVRIQASSRPHELHDIETDDPPAAPGAGRGQHAPSSSTRRRSSTSASAEGEAARRGDREMEEAARHQLAGGCRRACRADRRRADRHPGVGADDRGPREAAEAGGPAARARRRPGRGGAARWPRRCAWRAPA